MRTLGRLLAGAVLAAWLANSAAAEVSTAVRHEDRAVAGLGQPAEIIVDRWGIPHIYAKSAKDAFFLQGYNAARDRLWQIDLWRKRGLGRLSASFGPAYVAQDRAAGGGARGRDHPVVGTFGGALVDDLSQLPGRIGLRGFLG